MNDKESNRGSKPEVPSDKRIVNLTSSLGCCLALFFLVCTGLIVPIVQMGWMVTTGWYFFLQRTSSEMHIRLGSFIGFGISLLLLLFLTHRTALWLTTARGSDVSSVADELSNPTWPFLRSCKLLLVVFSSFIAGVFLVAISHEIVWMMTSKEPMVTWDYPRPARRTQSKNNLKVLGLAFHNYHDLEQTPGFPASATLNEQGRIRHSWMTALLPYLDQAPLLKKIRLDLSWSAPENRSSFQTELSSFLNPAIPHRTDSAGYALSHYAGNRLVLLPGRKRPIREITDGTSNTILAGEVNSRFDPWGKPGNCRDPRLGINKSLSGFGSPFKGGSQFLMADGSVRFISETIDPKVLNALATPDGGETVGDY